MNPRMTEADREQQASRLDTLVRMRDETIDSLAKMVDDVAYYVDMCGVDLRHNTEQAMCLMNAYAYAKRAIDCLRGDGR